MKPFRWLASLFAPSGGSWTGWVVVDSRDVVQGTFTDREDAHYTAEHMTPRLDPSEYDVVAGKFVRRPQIGTPLPPRVKS